MTDTRKGNFVIGVGGSGAMLMRSLVHLSAAGLMPDSTGGLHGFLVDPDQANGSGDVTHKLTALYGRCKALQLGRTDLFKTAVSVEGPWSPVGNSAAATLETIFGYTDMRAKNPAEADLMDLMFDPEERALAIFQGFRGRPAIGATILGRTVNFRSGEWGTLRQAILDAGQGQEAVPLLLTGSVFGGSGAAGVPTICRLLQQELAGAMRNARVGLMLFLPYFQYKLVPGELMQANPDSFSAATIESLKYYDERRFVDICTAIYAAGEEQRATQPVSAVGGKLQANDPHFIELVASLGAIRFMKGEGVPHSLSLSARASAETVTWSDLPAPDGTRLEDISKLRTMALFAVAFRFIFYATLVRELDASRGTDKHHHAVLSRHATGVKSDRVTTDLKLIYDYLESFLEWLVKLSSPTGLANYRPGLLKLDVVAVPEDGGWRLKKESAKPRGGEFDEDQLRNLFLNSGGVKIPSARELWKRAENSVDDPHAFGTGKLVRALYEACVLR